MRNAVGGRAASEASDQSRPHPASRESAHQILDRAPRSRAERRRWSSSERSERSVETTSASRESAEPIRSSIVHRGHVRYAVGGRAASEASDQSRPHPASRESAEPIRSSIVHRGHVRYAVGGRAASEASDQSRPHPASRESAHQMLDRAPRSRAVRRRWSSSERSERSVETTSRKPRISPSDARSCTEVTCGTP